MGINGCHVIHRISPATRKRLLNEFYCKIWKKKKEFPSLKPLDGETFHHELWMTEASLNTLYIDTAVDGFVPWFRAAIKTIADIPVLASVFSGTGFSCRFESEKWDVLKISDRFCVAKNSCCLHLRSDFVSARNSIRWLKQTHVLILKTFVTKNSMYIEQRLWQWQKLYWTTEDSF